MKLIRFGNLGQEKPGLLLEDGQRKDCSAFFQDWNPEFFQSNGLEKLSQLNVAELPLVHENERWGAPIARPGKVVCIGLNYSDHAAESGMPIPTEPIVFLKGSNTVCGPYDPILIPRGSSKTDWEVELGVIIKKNARYLSTPDEAWEYVAGYCISHDISEREFQLERGGQWTKGKSCDDFNPLGPWLVTPNEIPAVDALDMKLSVNGVMKQNGSTATMIFDVAYIIHYLSQFMTLEAGDVITTGTPPGVGLGHKPPQYLKVGDEVVLSITGLGEQRAICQQA